MQVRLAVDTPVLVHNSNCDPRFEVDSKGTVTDRTNTNGRVGTPELDGGTLQQVGARVWGRGDPSHLIGTCSAAELRSLASKSDAEKLQDFYQSAALAGRGGKTAPARVTLTQEILERGPRDALTATSADDGCRRWVVRVVEVFRGPEEFPEGP